MLEWKVQAENDLFDILDYDIPDPAVDLVRDILIKIDGSGNARRCTVSIASVAPVN
jgi:hypothetical protein